MKSEMVGFITMSCNFMLLRPTVETKVIVGDCAWQLTLAVYKILPWHSHKINTRHSRHILAKVEILAGCV
jgi:hypothetical protein